MTHCLLHVSWTRQACLYLRAFALAGSSSLGLGCPCLHSPKNGLFFSLRLRCKHELLADVMYPCLPSLHATLSSLFVFTIIWNYLPWVFIISLLLLEYLGPREEVSSQSSSLLCSCTSTEYVLICWEAHGVQAGKATPAIPTEASVFPSDTLLPCGTLDLLLAAKMLALGVRQITPLTFQGPRW